MSAKENQSAQRRHSLMHYGKDMKLRNSLLINEIYHFLGVKLVWSELATEKRYPAWLIPIYFLR